MIEASDEARLSEEIYTCNQERLIVSLLRDHSFWMINQYCKKETDETRIYLLKHTLAFLEQQVRLIFRDVYDEGCHSIDVESLKIDPLKIANALKCSDALTEKLFQKRKEDFDLGDFEVDNEVATKSEEKNIDLEKQIPPEDRKKIEEVIEKVKEARNSGIPIWNDKSLAQDIYNFFGSKMGISSLSYQYYYKDLESAYEEVRYESANLKKFLDKILR